MKKVQWTPADIVPQVRHAAVLAARIASWLWEQKARVDVGSYNSYSREPIELTRISGRTYIPTCTEQGSWRHAVRVEKHGAGLRR
jgi:hypothetical protein